jgi:hypothetical protein
MNKYLRRVNKLKEIFRNKKQFYDQLPNCTATEFNDAMHRRCVFRTKTHLAVVGQLQDYADELVIKHKWRVGDRRKLERQRGFTKSPRFKPDDWTFSPDEILNPQALENALENPTDEVDHFIANRLSADHHSDAESSSSDPAQSPNLNVQIATKLNALIKGPSLVQETIRHRLVSRPLTLRLADPTDKAAYREWINRRVIEDLFPDWVKQRHVYEFDADGLLRNFPHRSHLETDVNEAIDQVLRRPGLKEAVVHVPTHLVSMTHRQVDELIRKLENKAQALRVSMNKGCTEYKFVGNSEDISELVSWIRENGAGQGGLSLVSVKDIEEEKEGASQEPSLLLQRARPVSGEDIDRFLAQVGRQYEPRSLIARMAESVKLLWAVILLGKAGLTVGTSRFYLSPGLLAKNVKELFSSNEKSASVTREALTYTFFYWPILTFCVTFVPAYALTWQSGAAIALSSALFATVMGLAGSLVCGPLFPILGVGAGGAGFGIMFGITQAVLAVNVAANMNPVPVVQGMSLFAQISFGTDPFVATVLGAIGTSAQFISLSMLPFFLTLPSCAIIMSAWLMGNPRATDDKVMPPFREAWLNLLSRHSTLQKAGQALAVTLGAFVGISGVGIVKGLYVGVTTLAHLENAAGKSIAFWSVVMLVGGACYMLCVWLRTKEWSRALLWGIGYAITAGVFGVLIWSTRGRPASFFFTELSTAFFHACFFTLSYAVGFALQGRRAAFLAAAIEGTLGFVLFNIINFFQSHSVAPVPSDFPYSWITVLLIVATIIWMTTALYQVVSLRPASIRSVSDWLIPCVLVSYLILLCLLPKPKLDVPWPVVRAVHYGGIAVLFGFLIFGAICQCQVWHVFRNPGPGSLSLLANIYKKWWASTKLLPAPAAFCILFSGLRLIYEDSGHGFLALGWLFWLVAGFSFFFFDGLMFYLPEICSQFKAVEAAKGATQTIQDFVVEHRKPFHEAMLFFHSLSFPFVFFVGCFKPGLPFPHKFVDWLQTAGDAISTEPDKARFWTAALLVAIIGAAWLALRLRGLIKYITYLFASDD